MSVCSVFFFKYTGVVGSFLLYKQYIFCTKQYIFHFWWNMPTNAYYIIFPVNTALKITLMKYE